MTKPKITSSILRGLNLTPSPLQVTESDWDAYTSAYREKVKADPKPANLAILDALERRTANARRLLEALGIADTAKRNKALAAIAKDYVKRESEARMKTEEQVVFSVKRNRETGTHTYVVVRGSSEFDYGQDSKYGIVCDDHSTTVSVDTLDQAKYVARHPTEFCDDCRLLVSKSKRDR